MEVRLFGGKLDDVLDWSYLRFIMRQINKRKPTGFVEFNHMDVYQTGHFFKLLKGNLCRGGKNF